MANSPSLAQLLEGHVRLDCECFDRLYLNVYQPKLQTPGGVVYFLHDHRGNPIPSPALFRPMGDAYRKSVSKFAEDAGIEMIRFKAGDRKIDVVTPYLEKATSPGVVVIGQAQEVQRVTVGTDLRRHPETGCPHYSFNKVDRRVTVYYFYAQDQQWGPSFLKMCAYFPYPAKMWCNGHEWVKAQLRSKGIGFTALANGFACVDDHRELKRLCDMLGPRQVQDLFERWMARVPLPFDAADFEAGYIWEASMNQIEFSRTLVLDRPARARAFFDRVIESSATLGRPSEIELIFDRRVQKNTPGMFLTKVVNEGVEPRVSIFYKNSRVKLYLKQGKGARIETVINNPTDIGVKRRIEHLGALGAICRQVNRRILDVCRVASAPDLSTSLFEQVALPDVSAGQRTVALRYGEIRVMALMAALTLCLHQIQGFTNKGLRSLVATLIDKPFSMNQMSYDLWRLRTNGLIERLPKTNTYVLTPNGIRVSLFYTKSYRRIIDPLFAAGGTGPQARAAPQLRDALRTIDQAVDRFAKEARIAA
ncbi:MAG: hypothetical protein ACRD1R_04235 [Acidobacteriota bacterium]